LKSQLTFPIGIRMANYKFLGVGGAHIDRRGFIADSFVPGVSNPGKIREEAGGAVLNALRTIANLGHETNIISAIGGDNAGRQIVAIMREARIGDHCAVFLDRATASYTALIDPSGALIAGLADMEIYEIGLNRHMRSRSVRDLAADADAILFDANIPSDGIEYLFKASAGKPLYAIAVSPAKAVRLKPFLPRIKAIFMNRAEALALAGLPDEAGTADCIDALRAAGLQSGMITDGANSLAGFDRNVTLELLPPQAPEIADVTGAGDALAAAAAVAFTSGKPLGDAMREGTAAAIAAISSPSAVPSLDNKTLERVAATVETPRTLARTN
jgi:pseudouridine kinase